MRFSPAGRQGRGKSTAVSPQQGTHRVVMETDKQHITTFGSSQVQVITTGFRLKCGCGWSDAVATQEEAHRLMNAHLDGKLDEEIQKLEQFERVEPVVLTPRDREDARVRQGTIEILLGDE